MPNSEDPMHLSSPEEQDPDQFFRKAKNIVKDYHNQAVDDAWEDHELELEKIDLGDIYIVWFSKTLQNWKALLSTSKANGLYYELTYDGNKKQTYLDVYEKQVNTAIPDEE